MSRPWFLYENILETGALTLGSGGGQAETQGYPLSNVTDWRTATPFRFQPTLLNQNVQINIDLGDGTGGTPGAQECDMVCFGGHLMATDGGTPTVYHSDDDISYSVASFAIPSDNLPLFIDLGSPGSHRYWRITLFATMTECSLGIVTLGRKLTLEYANAALSPMSEDYELQHVRSQVGAPLGSNVRTRRKRFSLAYDQGTAGLSDTDFFSASGVSFDGLVEHAIENRKPFWFSGGLTTTYGEDDLFLCTAEQALMPDFGRDDRRGLTMQMNAWREVT